MKAAEGRDATRRVDPLQGSGGGSRPFSRVNSSARARVRLPRGGSRSHAASTLLGQTLLLTMLHTAPILLAADFEIGDGPFEAPYYVIVQAHADDATIPGGYIRSTDPSQPNQYQTGVVSPGHSPACVSNTGNVTFNVSSVLQVELLGTTPCSQYDRFSVGGTLTLQGGTLQVSFIDLTHGGPSFVPSAGAHFQILAWGTMTGRFGSIALPALPDGLAWNTSSLYTTGTLAIDEVPIAAQPVPMGAGVLVGLGVLLAWAGVRRI